MDKDKHWRPVIIICMKLLIIILLLFTISVSMSDAAYMNNTKISLDNGAYITVMNTNFSSLKKYGEASDPQYTLEYTINGSRIRYTTETNKTLTSPAFNVILDNFSVNVAGDVGFINFSAVMNNATDIYNFTSSAIYVEGRNASIDRVVYFNYTGLYPTNFVVSWSKYWGHNLSGYVMNTLEFYFEGARVDLTNQSRVFSDEDGYYSFPNIRNGNYTILFRQIGYRNSTSNITINSSDLFYNVTMSENKMPAIKMSPGFDGIGILLAIIIIFILRKMSDEL